MFNPISFFKGASTQFQLIIIGVVFVTGFLTGWRVHGWKTDASEYHGIKQVEKVRQKDAVQAAKIVDSNEKTKEVIRYVYKTIYKKAETVGDANNICFTDDSLRLWNDSIAAANSYRKEPIAEIETDDSTETSELVATVEEVLKNGIENTESCALNAQDHDALVDRIESLDGQMCYCSK